MAAGIDCHASPANSKKKKRGRELRGRKLKINKIINKPFPRPAWQWHGAVRAGATSCTGSRGRPLAVAGGEAATEDAALAMASAVAAGAAGAVTVATAARGQWQWRQPVDGRPD